jgi:hypothetical protein
MTRAFELYLRTIMQVKEDKDRVVKDLDDPDL